MIQNRLAKIILRNYSETILREGEAEMDLWSTLTNRCSVRAYESRKPGTAEIDALLMAASLAPVGMGLYEHIHLTVVTNEAVLEEIDRATARKMGREDAHPIYGVPVLIVVSSCPGKFVIPGIRELNCGCIMENMMLAATEEGLGSVFLLAATEALRESTDIMAKLNIPEGYIPVGALGVGYPAAELKAKEKELKFAVNTVN